MLDKLIVETEKNLLRVENVGRRNDRKAFLMGIWKIIIERNICVFTYAVLLHSVQITLLFWLEVTTKKETV